MGMNAEFGFRSGSAPWSLCSPANPSLLPGPTPGWLLPGTSLTCSPVVRTCSPSTGHPSQVDYSQDLLDRTQSNLGNYRLPDPHSASPAEHPNISTL
ncbi:hypothetical protein GOODEAATRI_024739 [Goodea atripinnis]|uniref:Uncharacterized protein n=1 Tax=Goodea atripinnis TaxID=208336 RepID=A0ABV0PRD6_9TELE